MAFGPGGETVRLDGGARHYAVNWNTRDFDLVWYHNGPAGVLLGRQ